ncbi:MAG: hypothetical protein ABI644_14335 [Arenimonas sp.]
MCMLSASLLLFVGCKAPLDETGDKSTSAMTTEIPEVKPPIEQVSATNDPNVINFQGFGSAKFGGNEESVRMAWGRPLNTSKPAEGSTCVYLNPETMPDVKRGIGFMFEESKFVRYDVDDASQIAPGNFKVGDTAIDIKKAFAGRVEEAPHKYIPKGFTLTITPEDKSGARLIFEIGEDGKVSKWRIGMPPQVFYVEACG